MVSVLASLFHSKGRSGCWYPPGTISVSPKPPCVSASFQVRKKTNSVNAGSGIWNFYYSDSERAALVAFPIPGINGVSVPLGPWGNGYDPYSFADPSGEPLEVGVVVGPNSVEVFHHHYRGGLGGLCSDGGNPQEQYIDNFFGVTNCRVYQPWLLGRLYQHAVYSPGTLFSAQPSSGALQTSRYNYGPGHASVVPIRAKSDSTPGSYTIAGNQRPYGSPEGYFFNGLLTSTTVKRGSQTFVKSQPTFDSECSRITSTTESNGARVRSTTTVYSINAYCQVSESTLYANAARVQRVKNDFTSDRKSVEAQTVYGTTDAIAITTTSSYHPNGELKSRTDPLGYRSWFTSYKRGTPEDELHPVTAIDAGNDPGGSRIQLKRMIDDLGRIVSEIDGEGREVRFTYNGQHKPTSITPARGAGLGFTYGTTQDLITRGSRTETVKYDGFGRMIESNNGVFTTKYRYDAGGRRVFVSYPGSELGQSVEYDALDRPVKLREPDPSSAAGEVTTQITYDDSAHKITVKPPNGGETKLTMEAFGDPSDAWVKKQELPAGAGTIEYTRNVFGQIEKIVSRSGTPEVVVTREMKYNADKGYYLIEETHPELGLIKYDRDNNGNMIGRTVGGTSKTTYAYDGQNRLTSVTPPGGDSAPAITRTWWKTGKPKSIVAGGVTRNYTFDANDNLATETVLIDGVSRTLSYMYDSLDSLSQVSYPSGRIVELNPDLLGRATTATPFVSSATYHPSGMLKQLNFGNGTVQNFDEQRRPMVDSNKIVKGGAALLHLGFGYDQNANMTSLTEPTSDAQHGYARNASYDLFDRIKSIGSETFDYEGIGDFKTTKNSAGALNSFTYDLAKRRLSAVTGAAPRSYGYDIYGNVSSDGRGFTYAYDAYSTLRSTSGTSANSQYVYDGHQHMAKQTTNGVTKHFLYGMSGRMFGEYPATGSTGVGVREFIHLSGKMVGQAVSQ
jgi:YD repeat-containing protein